MGSFGVYCRGLCCERFSLEVVGGMLEKGERMGCLRGHQHSVEMQ